MALSTNTRIRMLRLFGKSSPESHKKAFSLSLNRIEDNEKYRLPYFFPTAAIFLSSDSISGVAELGTGNTKNVAISIIGQVRNKSDDSLQLFYDKKKIIEATTPENAKIQFQFKGLKFPAPSFYGSQFDVRYLVRFGNKEVFEDVPIYVLFVNERPEKAPTFHSEVGIQNILHFEIVLRDQNVDCGGILIGKVFFGLVKLRLQSISLQILRDEEYDNGIVRSKVQNLISNFDIMDGSPVRGDSIPIRIMLPGIKIWPLATESEIGLKVGYTVRFVVIDEDGKKYFKSIANEVCRYIR